MMIISSISFSQTVNARLGEFETNVNYFDSTLNITLQIKLNENESSILGHAHNVKLTFNSLALEYVSGEFLNFNEAQGYVPTLIFNPGQSPTIHIDSELSYGTGTEVNDSYIDFVVILFNIIDFSQVPTVCPGDNDFLFYSPGSQVAWLIGEWLCYEGHTPVELTSFAAIVSNGLVALSWISATETNNQGFEVQRSAGGEFETIAFIEGHGTTTESQAYAYNDRNVNAGTYTYRLKQVDFDGSFEYLKVIEVDVPVLQEFSFEQNYPNPFNPSTKISWQSPVGSHQTLKIFDILGNEIATLVNEYKPAGKYEVEFNAANLPSGVYFYQLKAGSFVETKKMVLLK